MFASIAQARNPPRGPDFDADGYDDMAIGTPSDSETVSLGGGVNILYGSSSGPEAPSMTTLHFDQDTSGVPGVQESGDYLGRALAYGDFDGDGYDDLVIGVHGEDVGAITDAGLVNVLYGGSGGLSGSGAQSFSGGGMGATYEATASDQFGQAIAAGDFDGDGYDDVAISAPYYDDGATYSVGGVVIFYGTSSGLSSSGQQFFDQDTSGMAGDGNESQDQWGMKLVSGDFDCDGYEDLAVSAYYEDIAGYAGSNHGAVTVLYGTAGGLSITDSQWWHQGVGTIGGTPESGELFGGGLGAGNFDGDSSASVDCVDLAIGVPLEAIGSTTSNGAVNIIYGSTSGLTDTGNQILYQGNGLAGSVSAGGQLGWNLTVGRFNYGTYDDLATSAIYADPGSNTSAGEIYMAKGTSSGLTSSGGVRWDSATADVPGTREAYDNWGWWLSYAEFEGTANEHYLVVGAIGEDSSQGAVSTIELDSTGADFDALSGVEWKQDDIEGTPVNNETFGYALPAPRLKARPVM